MLPKHKAKPSSKAEILAHYILKKPGIAKLDLSNKGFTDADVPVIIKMISQLPKLEDLNLAGNKLTAVGIRKLTPILMNNKNIRLLNLMGNQLGDDGAHALAPLLQVNRTLLHIDISDNEIQNKGIVAIFNALRVNKKLCSLIAANNEVSDLTKVEGIKINLKYLNLSYNYLDKTAVVLLLKQAPKLQILNLSYNQFATILSSEDEDDLLTKQKIELRNLYAAVNAHPELAKLHMLDSQLTEEEWEMLRQEIKNKKIIAEDMTKQSEKRKSISEKQTDAREKIYVEMGFYSPSKEKKEDKKPMPKKSQSDPGVAREVKKLPPKKAKAPLKKEEFVLGIGILREGQKEVLESLVPKRKKS